MPARTASNMLILLSVEGAIVVWLQFASSIISGKETVLTAGRRIAEIDIAHWSWRSLLANGGYLRGLQCCRLGVDNLSGCDDQLQSFCSSGTEFSPSGGVWDVSAARCIAFLVWAASPSGIISFIFLPSGTDLSPG